MENKSKKFNPILLVPIIIAAIACLAITHFVIVQHEQKVVNQTVKSMYPDAKNVGKKISEYDRNLSFESSGLTYYYCLKKEDGKRIIYIMNRDDTARAIYKVDYDTGDIIFPVSNEDVESLKPAEPATDSPDSKSFVSSMCSKNGNYNNEKRRKKLKMAKTFVEKKFEEMRLWAIEHKLVDEFDNEILEILTVKMSDKDVDGIEYCCDTGYQHIGISIKSQKHEYVNEERILLKDETERNNDCRKYRRTRRNKLRYRKARWNNRHNNLICKDGFAPSIRNKRDVHINLFKMYHEVCPITSATFEMGQFDTQLLKAVENGNNVPQGTDYQHGERYGYSTLREAVFARDNYKCVCCRKSAIKSGLILKIHHLGYRIGDRSNRMSNLATVCSNCHTSKNHQKGGKLYDLKPKLKTFKGATFMTMVRYDMFSKLKESAPDIKFNMTYGALTKLKRKDYSIKKSHSNDAYCMGVFHPKHRTDFKCYQKLRRNNRILSKFYDAKYIDLRDGTVKSGKQLSCNRTNRRELRNSNKNERIYRGPKTSKGKTVVRKQHYQYRPYDFVWYKNVKYAVKGVQDKGKRIALQNHLPVSISKIKKSVHVNGWKLVI